MTNASIPVGHGAVKIALAASIPVAAVMMAIAFYLCKRFKKPHKHVPIASAGNLMLLFASCLRGSVIMIRV